MHAYIYTSVICFDFLNTPVGLPTLQVNITKTIMNLSVIVQWDEVDDSLPINYTVKWTSDERSSNSMQSHTLMNKTLYTIIGLTIDIVYTITITAANKVCTGPEYRSNISFPTGMFYFHYNSNPPINVINFTACNKLKFNMLDSGTLLTAISCLLDNYYLAHDNMYRYTLCDIKLSASLLDILIHHVAVVVCPISLL